MKYILEYFNKAAQKTVTVTIEKDTDKKAIKVAHKILQCKNHKEPGLYDALEYGAEE